MGTSSNQHTTSLRRIVLRLNYKSRTREIAHSRRGHENSVAAVVSSWGIGPKKIVPHFVLARCEFAIASATIVSKNVIIVGGGLAGLSAAVFLARAGRTVTIFERRRYLGGRAVTHLRHGYRFNLGPHAFYRNGLGWNVLRELGIPVRGGIPKPRGLAMIGSDRYKLPSSPWALLTTSLFGLKAKVQVAQLLLRIRRIDPKPFASMTVREWIDANASDERVRQVLEALFRLATYSDRSDLQSASVALTHLRLAIRGVVYIDEGWQKIVDSLHSAAVASGVNFVTSSRVVGVHHDGGAVRGVELGGLEVDVRNDTMSLAMPDLSDPDKGTRIPAETVLLAVDPVIARELAPSLDWPSMTTVTAACLDVALSRLPVPGNTFALGIDKPLYYSVHSKWAQLTPKGGALLHAMRYGEGTEQELEALIDEMQPGWRDLVVHRRFLPAMTVSNALVEPEGKAPRMRSATSIQGLYVAGDWVAEGGILSDAAFASARAAAKAILAAG
jgi:phytoene dehydrogenase-like protein